MHLLKLKNLLSLESSLSPDEVSWVLEETTDHDIKNLTQDELWNLRELSSHFLQWSHVDNMKAHLSDEARVEQIVSMINDLLES